MKEIKIKVETTDNKKYYTSMNQEDFVKVMSQINTQRSNIEFLVLKNLIIRLNKVDVVSILNDESAIPQGVKVVTSPERVLTREQTENILKACEMFVSRSFQ